MEICNYFLSYTFILNVFVFSLPEAIRESKTNVSPSLLENVILDSGFPKVTRARESVHIRQCRDDPDHKSKWFILDGSDELVVAVASNSVSLRNFKSTISTIQCNGLVTVAVAVQGVANTILAVALENEENHELLFINVENSTLVETERLSINHLVTKMSVWLDLVVLVWRNQLEIYKKSHGRLLLLEVGQVEGVISDLAFTRYLNGWLAVVAIPSANQIAAFHVTTGEIKLRRLSALSLSEPKAVAVFLLGSNTMIAVGGAEAGVWRMRSDNSFVPLSTLHGAVDNWLPVSIAGSRHHVLLMGRKNDEVIVLESDGYYNFLLLGNITIFCAKGDEWCYQVVPDLLRGSSAADTILVPSVGGDLFLLRLEYELQNGPGPVQLIRQEMEELRKEIKVAYERQNGVAGEIMEEEKTAVSVNNSHLVQAEWVVDRMDIARGDFAPNSDDNEFQVEEWSFAGRDDWTEVDMEIDIDDMAAFVKSLQNDVIDAKEKSPKSKSNPLHPRLVELERVAVAFKTRSDRTASASKLQDIIATENEEVSEELPSTILGMLTVIGHVRVKNLTVDAINGETAQQWASDSFRLDNPQPILGKKVAPAVECSDIRFNKIADIAASELVHVTDDAIIEGDLIIEAEATVASDVTLVNGTVNGLNIKQDLMSLNSLHTGWTVIESVVVTDSARLEVISTGGEARDVIMPVNMSPHNVNPAILQLKVDDVIVRKHLIANYINGVELKKLLPQQNADEVHIDDLKIDYLNGIKFPEGFVLTTSNSPVMINGKKTFTNLQANKLNTDFRSFFELLSSGKPFARSTEVTSDGVLKSSAADEMHDNQMDAGDIRQKPVTFVFNHLQVDTVRAMMLNNRTLKDLKANAENASTLVKQAFLPKKRCRTKGLSESDNDGNNDDYNEINDEFNTAFLDAQVIEVHGSITTDESASGLHLDKYANYLSRSKDQTFPAKFLKHEVTVAKLTTSEPPTSHRVRSVHDVISITDVEKLHIYGRLDSESIIFEDNVVIDDLAVNGTVDGVNFTAVHEDAVLNNSSNIFLRGLKIFKNELKANTVNTYMMNRKKPSWIITRSGDHTFSRPVKFTNVSFTADLHATGFVNNANLTDLIGKVSSKYGAFLVLGDLELHPGASVDYFVVDGLVQNTNISKLMSEVVFKTDASIDFTDFYFSFNKSVSFDGALTISNHLNGMNLTAFLMDIVLMNRSALVSQLILEKNPIINRLNVSGSLYTPLLDGCDITKWAEEAIYLNQDILESVVVKLADVAVMGGDVSTYLLNGRSLESLIPLKLDQVIPATLLIRKLAVADQLKVGHSVNGRFLPDVWKDSLRHNSYQRVKGWKIFLSDVEVEGNVEVESIGTRKIRNLVTLHTDQNITDVNVEGEVTARGDLRTSAYVGGVPVAEWGQRVVLNGITQNVSGSWTVTGNTTASSGISGSGIVLGQSVPKVSKTVEEKMLMAKQIDQNIFNDYQKQCDAVDKSAATTENQLRMLHMFEDIQGLQFHLPLQSAIYYRFDRNDYVLATFVGRCSARLYKWSETDNKFVKQLRLLIGPIEVWTTLSTPNATYLVVSGPRSCHRNKPSSAIWQISGTNFTELARMDEFSDVMSDNQLPNVFHSIAPNGTAATWQIIDGMIVKKSQTIVPAGKYKFVSQSLGLDLALWDGDNIVPLNSSLSSRLPGASAALGPFGLVALSDGLSRIELHRDGSLVHSLHHNYPTDLYWLDLKAPGELYLMFASEHHRIYIYQYKGVAGLVRKSVLSYPSSRILLIDLPQHHTARIPHILVVYDRVIHLLQIKMHGRPGIHLDLNCLHYN